MINSRPALSLSNPNTIHTFPTTNRSPSKEVLMMKRTHLQEKIPQDSAHAPTKSRFAPRPFVWDPTPEAPSTESPDRASRFGHSFGDIDIFHRPVIQPKLTLGPVDDKYEQEADRVARRVVETISSSDQESVQRQEDLEDEDELDLEEATELRLKVAGLAPVGGADLDPDLESVIQSAQGRGQPLSDSVRQPMERAFGADFGGVRLHTNGQADSLNRSIQARAFTTGQDVFFRQGEYRPGSSEGKGLLAHELTHVVQQTKRKYDQYNLKSRNINVTALGEQISRSFRIRGSTSYETTVHNHLDNLRENSPTAENLYTRLSGSGTTVEINETTGSCATNRVHNVVLVYYNFSRCPGTPNGDVHNSIYLGHELIHALHRIEGTHQAGAEEEWRTVGLGRHATLNFTENRIRCEKQIQPRTFYYATDEARYRRQGYGVPRCNNRQYEHPLLQF